jgi:hypothetical protein
MLDQPFANKWDMRKKANLKESMENSASMFGGKSFMMLKPKQNHPFCTLHWLGIQI